MCRERQRALRDLAPRVFTSFYEDMVTEIIVISDAKRQECHGERSKLSISRGTTRLLFAGLADTAAGRIQRNDVGCCIGRGHGPRVRNTFRMPRGLVPGAGCNNAECQVAGTTHNDVIMTNDHII